MIRILITREKRGMQNASVLNKYLQRFYPYPLKFKVLIEEGVPFKFTRKFQSRPTENQIKLTKKCTIVSLQYQYFFILNSSTTFQNNFLRCQTLIQIKFRLQNYKLDRGFVHGKTNFLIILISMKILYVATL